MTARGKPVATEENQVLWKFSESESWSVHEDEVTGELVVQGNLRLPVFQKIQGILTLKEGNGHIIFTCPPQSCLTWTKSIRL